MKLTTHLVKSYKGMIDRLSFGLKGPLLRFDLKKEQSKQEGREIKGDSPFVRSRQLADDPLTKSSDANPSAEAAPSPPRHLPAVSSSASSRFKLWSQTSGRSLEAMALQKKRKTWKCDKQ
ncbi:hypothetical protein GW17_00054338 [Ensete ventricosum]|nr:hypothetical protein GW17_00054338 [Ensete ventricosum]